MTVESIRRVTLTWPTTGTAFDPVGGHGPTLADVERAFHGWVTEARAQGCPGGARVHVDRYPGPGMLVQWDATDDVPPGVRCTRASEHALWASLTGYGPGDTATDDGVTGTLVTCSTCRDGIVLDPDEEQPDPAPDEPTTSLVTLLAEARDVLAYVSRGRGYVGVEPYPDVAARRILAAITDTGCLPDPAIDEPQPDPTIHATTDEPDPVMRASIARTLGTVPDSTAMPPDVTR